jgi:hypothetical protein
MKLYLLPISTRRTLLYCQRAAAAPTQEQTLMDKVQARAARLWAGWEKKEKGWQKKVVEYGNYAFRRIPYEEWGLKSVPSLSKKMKEEVNTAARPVEVVYPKTLIPVDRVSGILHTLSTEREGLHKRRLIWCFVGMPISAPFALVPVYAFSFLASGRNGKLTVLQYSQHPLLLSLLPRLVSLARF